jgi:hypothetical protein
MLLDLAAAKPQQLAPSCPCLSCCNCFSKLLLQRALVLLQLLESAIIRNIRVLEGENGAERVR